MNRLVVLIVVYFSKTCSAADFSSGSSSGGAEVPFIETGLTPACPADLFDMDLVTVSCYQGEKTNTRIRSTRSRTPLT